MKRPSLKLLSKKNSGIIRPSDFKSKTIATTGAAGSVRDFEVQFYTMMQLLNLPNSRMQILPYDPTYKDFLEDKIDVTAAYLTGGVIRLKQQGYDLNIIWPGDYGVIAYSDTLVATDSFIHINPDLVLRFVRATLKGWSEAIGDPQAAVQATMKYARVQDIPLQTAMMDAQAPLIHTGEDNIGWMKQEDWRIMCQILLDQKSLSRPIDEKTVFTMDFLEHIYKGGAK
ncbi:MAG: ABC transporter substrate-binding protein [Desulfatibacillum sp.]|nr:ABC transporter substrate-binding protein [Desulfatibacillum sp.]